LSTPRAIDPANTAIYSPAVSAGISFRPDDTIDGSFRARGGNRPPAYPAATTPSAIVTTHGYRGASCRLIPVSPARRAGIKRRRRFEVDHPGATSSRRSMARSFNPPTGFATERPRRG
jgi:hypothetical protein